MFPPNLQKSIRELDRQISMLETECENMETEKMDIGTRKSMTKDSFRSLPIKPFRTGPSQSSSPYGVKRHGLTNPRTLGKIVSAASVLLEGQTECIQQRGTHFVGRQTSFGIEEVACRKVTSDVAQNQILQNEVPTTNSGEKVEQKSFGFMEKSERKTMTVRSIKEVTESSGESSQVNVNGHSKLMCVTTSKTEQPDSTLEWNQKMRPKSSLTYCSNSNRPRLSSSDEDAVKQHSVGHSPSPKRNRPRSTRTKKKKETEIILDVNSEKPVREQETQCTIFREEWEKKEFLANLNDSVKTLQMLISELKKKNCQETQKDILNDMQNTLLKISQTKSNNPLGSTLNLLTSLQGGTLKVPEGEETIVDLKKVFYRVRQFCEQLSEEKYFLTEELAHRNRTIAGMKTKEKEYLSLISTLKLNLERTNQKSEEWDRAKKEVMMVRTKLEEETKVIDALKRSYGKMQDLVENYVLDNDKLRTQMRIAKLESQKYTVLLAGKEEEIKKYKTEMAAFQRQICEQLEIIRSKASENQVENAFTTIARHTNLLCQTDLESLPSESNQLSRSVTKTSLDSLSSDRHQEDKCAFSVETVVDAESKEMTTVTNCGHNSIDENSCGSDHSQPRSSNAICTANKMLDGVKRSARKRTSLQNSHDIPARMLFSNSSDECSPQG